MDCKASKPCLLVIDGDYFGKHALQGEAFLSLYIIIYIFIYLKKNVCLFIFTVCNYFIFTVYCTIYLFWACYYLYILGLGPFVSLVWVLCFEKKKKRFSIK